MTRTLIGGALTLLVALGCTSDAEDEPRGTGGQIPAVLSELILTRDSDEIPPVLFPHAKHSDPKFVGKQLDCTDCHHTLEDMPDSVPMACGICHPHEPEDGKPPDI